MMATISAGEMTFGVTGKCVRLPVTRNESAMLKETS